MPDRNASWAAVSSRCPVSPPACEATARPPASDSRAASAAGAGIPATASSMPPRYPLASTDPRIATPSAPPVMRVASLTAEPTLAFSSGSEPMIASVAGAIAMPIPMPSTVSEAATMP